MILLDLTIQLGQILIRSCVLKAVCSHLSWIVLDIDPLDKTTEFVICTLYFNLHVNRSFRAKYTLHDQFQYNNYFQGHIVCFAHTRRLKPIQVDSDPQTYWYHSCLSVKLNCIIYCDNRHRCRRRTVNSFSWHMSVTKTLTIFPFCFARFSKAFEDNWIH